MYKVVVFVSLKSTPDTWKREEWGSLFNPSVSVQVSFHTPKNAGDDDASLKGQRNRGVEVGRR
jgi:hypothetical protein